MSLTPKTPQIFNVFLKITYNSYSNYNSSFKRYSCARLVLLLARRIYSTTILNYNSSSALAQKLRRRVSFITLEAYFQLELFVYMLGKAFFGELIFSQGFDYRFFSADLLFNSRAATHKPFGLLSDKSRRSRLRDYAQQSSARRLEVSYATA